MQSTVVEAFDEAGVFQKLLEAAQSVVTQQSGMQPADVAAMYIALVQFTSAVYPDRLDYINQALTACHTVGEGQQEIATASSGCALMAEDLHMTLKVLLFVGHCVLMIKSPEAYSYHDE